MRHIIFIITAFFLFSTTAVEAQLFKQYKLGYSTTAVGVSRLMPSFNSDVNIDGGWNAFFLRNGIFEFQFGEGDFTLGQPGETNFSNGEGQFLALGVVVPLHKATVIQRTNYWKGVHVVPLLGVHYTTQTMKLANGSNTGQAGVNFAPALAIQFPLGMIDLRLNNSFYFGGKERMSQFRKPGYLFTPSISFQIDGLFEMLGGRKTATGEYQTTWRELESIETEEEEFSNYKTKTTRMTYKYKSDSGTSFRKLIGAFWYISPYFSKGLSGTPTYDSENSTISIPKGNGMGVSIGGRYKFFMADIGVERNEGFYAIRDPEFIKELEGFESTFPLVEGAFSALEIRGKVGFDFISAIGNIVTPRQTRSLKSKDWAWTKFMRFNAGVSGGFSLPGDTDVHTINGGQLLDDFFTDNPSLVRDAKTDIRENKTAFTIGLFMDFELGPISIGYDWHGNHDFGWRSAFRVGYLVPINLMFRKK